MNIEEFVNDYLQEHRHEVLLSPYNGLVEFAEALKAEALKKAVEGEVENASFGIVYLRKNLANEGYSTGDKVRMIVLKKED